MKLANFLKRFVKEWKMRKDFSIISIRSDHGGEFVNSSFESFCISKGISHNFSVLEDTTTKWCGREEKPMDSY